MGFCLRLASVDHFQPLLRKHVCNRKCLSTPVAIRGQSSQASCEELPTPASLLHSPVHAPLTALKALNSVASTPHSNCCKYTNRDCSSFSTYQILIGLAHVIWCIAYNLMGSKHHFTYFNLNTSSLRLSLSFSKSLLYWRQKGNRLLKITKDFQKHKNISENYSKLVKLMMKVCAFVVDCLSILHTLSKLWGK